MTRIALTLALTVVIAAPLAAQQHRVNFALARDAHSTATMADLGAAITSKTEARAWYDSVDVALDALTNEASNGIARMHNGQPADYFVAVMAQPVMANGAATGATAYAFGMFTMSHFTKRYEYQTMGLGANTSAIAAAKELIQLTNAAIASYEAKRSASR